ncbi:UDP-N-acetylhexosamine pyrophosphorylase-like protein 1 [Anoplophora glabripennis]|uniref:UDP-N-acetylhexosamine pyrophosphorylase-like protein 1 n=1 Tax=Anoplophora glabripennis TaxID=217634 RepID=UPI000C769CB4|nr:UDP-N-acetylhexosamine pyrophosphorylase-like protein 1 [Anoplophora glabripennis]
MLSLEDIRTKLGKYNQSHVLQFWEELAPEAQTNFLSQLSDINFDDVSNLFNRALGSLSEETKKLDTLMEPIPPDQFEYEKGVDEDKLEEYRKKGLKAISKSRVAVLLLAGGQGTRLGVPYPKGMCPISLPSGKTLFQIQAERIRSVVRLAKKETGSTGRVCWYIMTSQATHDATAKFLEGHKYFGLNEDDVVLFQQGLLPSFSYDGRIILDRKDSISLAPDGNGGIYLALRKNNILQDMERRGVKYVHVHSVDNILVKVADPVFIGYCVMKGADCGNKVVRKEVPTEPVGVVCQVDGRFQVVEYSEITDQTANLRDDEGNLIFRAGNICNHFFTTGFLKLISENYEDQLKLHVARKKVPFVNEKGERVTPSSPNGIKIEKFIFDVFQFSKNFVTWEVPRHTEFSPVKNSESAENDCPSTARRDLLKLHKLYIQDAGGTVTCDEVEISPLVSYAGENLVERVYGKVFDGRTVISAEEEVVPNGF